MLKSKKKNKDAAENPDSPSKTALSKDHDHDQPINPESSTSGKDILRLKIVIIQHSSYPPYLNRIIKIMIMLIWQRESTNNPVQQTLKTMTL